MLLPVIGNECVFSADGIKEWVFPAVTGGVNACCPPVQARVVVYDTAMSVIADAYEPLMRCLKGKFVRDSEDLLPADHTRFLHLSAFLMALHRQEEAHRGRHGHKFDASAVAATLDIWSFAFVVKCCDSWLDAKNWAGLRCAAMLLKEMIAVRPCVCVSRSGCVIPCSPSPPRPPQTLVDMQALGDADTKELSHAIQKNVFYERDIIDVRPFPPLPRWAGFFPNVVPCSGVEPWASFRAVCVCVCVLVFFPRPCSCSPSCSGGGSPRALRWGCRTWLTWWTPPTACLKWPRRWRRRM